MSKHGTDTINLFFISIFMNKYTEFLPLRLYPTLTTTDVLTLTPGQVPSTWLHYVKLIQNLKNPER